MSKPFHKSPTIVNMITTTAFQHYCPLNTDANAAPVVARKDCSIWLALANHDIKQHCQAAQNIPINSKSTEYISLPIPRHNAHYGWSMMLDLRSKITGQHKHITDRQTCLIVRRSIHLCVAVQPQTRDKIHVQACYKPVTEYHHHQPSSNSPVCKVHRSA